MCGVRHIHIGMLNIWAHYNATAFLDEHRHIVKRKYFFSVLLTLHDFFGTKTYPFTFW